MTRWSKALDDETTRKRLLDLGAVLPDQAGRAQAWLKGSWPRRSHAGRRS